MRTALTELLGIEAPIVLAPMGGAGTPELAAAVSNAGGLGTLPLSWNAPDEIRSHVAEMAALTDRPYAVNLGLEWDQRERLRVALDAGVRVVSFFWGDPAELILAAHAAGAKTMVTVGSAEEAARAVAAGADVVVAQGWEAGGHVWGTVSTIALVPRVVDAAGPARLWPRVGSPTVVDLPQFSRSALPAPGLGRGSSLQRKRRFTAITELVC